MLTDGQRTKWRKNIAENFNRLSRAHQRYRQTDDMQTDDDIERERELLGLSMYKAPAWHRLMGRLPV